MKIKNQFAYLGNLLCWIVGVSFVALALFGGRSVQAETTVLPKLKGFHRIVFLGDSITQGGDYVTDIECWLFSQHQSVEVLDLGLGSETATDLTPEENAGHLQKYGFGRPFISERIDRLLAATKPDLVFVCYGMNDGGSLPAGDSGLKRYSEAVSRLREKILQSDVKQVVLLTPPVRECKAGEWTNNIADQNLTRYTEWLLAMKSKGWAVVDIHTPMRQTLEQQRAKNAEFGFTKDNVHPGREGHWIMARCVLEQYFGAKLDGISRAEDLFSKNGGEIRKLVNERMKMLFAAWMTQIKHQRPGVAGGPGAEPGSSVEEAAEQAGQISKRIATLTSN